MDIPVVFDVSAIGFVEPRLEVLETEVPFRNYRHSFDAIVLVGPSLWIIASLLHVLPAIIEGIIEGNVGFYHTVSFFLFD